MEKIDETNWKNWINFRRNENDMLEQLKNNLELDMKETNLQAGESKI